MALNLDPHGNDQWRLRENAVQQSCAADEPAVSDHNTIRFGQFERQARCASEAEVDRREPGHADNIRLSELHEALEADDAFAVTDVSSANSALSSCRQQANCGYQPFER